MIVELESYRMCNHGSTSWGTVPLSHFQHSIGTVSYSDCSPRIEFSIPGSEIEKFVIPGSRFGIRLTEFWYP